MMGRPSPARRDGRHTFTDGVRFGTAGNQRVTATDTATPSITGQSGPVLVFLPDATHFDVEIFSSTVTTGQAVDVRVTARNDNNDIDQGYRGTIAFTSTDAGATLPADRPAVEAALKLLEKAGHVAGGRSGREPAAAEPPPLQAAAPRQADEDLGHKLSADPADLDFDQSDADRARLKAWLAEDD